MKKYDSDRLACNVYATLHESYDKSKYQSSLNSELISLANAVSEEALHDACLLGKDFNIDRNRFGISIASECYASTKKHLTIQGNGSKKDALNSLNSTLPTSIAMKYQFLGPLDSPQQQCAAGTIAIGNAYRQIKDGYLDASLVGGIDFVWGSSVHYALDEMGGLNKYSNENPTQSLRPFDEERKGTVPGEGGALLVIESLKTAMERKAHIYCEIAGFHYNNEAFHLTSCRGDGLLKCMIGSLQEAGLKNNQIDSILAHGTGTTVGDQAEALAIKLLLGTSYEKLCKLSWDQLLLENTSNYDYENLKKVHVTANKGNFGHTGFSSGAIGAVLSAIQIEEGIIPKILNLTKPCEPLVNFTMNANVKSNVETVLINSQGVGSNTAALVFKKFQP